MIINPGMRRSGARRFSPLALFAASETGVWYDPSDLTTLFQDTAGITPVTAAGQTVALMLDKSRVPAPEARRNLLFLSQSIQTSPWIGNFVTGASSTELSPDGVTFAAAITGSGDTGTRWSQSYASAPIATYTFSVWLRAATNFDTEILLMGQSSIISVTTSWQRFSITRTTSSIATLVAGFRPSRTAGVTRTVFAWGGQLEVGAAATTYQPTGTIYPTAWLGTHATQATAAARPTYGIEPMTGRRNLVVQSQFASGWTVTSTSYTTNFAVAPDGTTSAARVTGGGSGFLVEQTLLTNSSGKTYTASFWVKSNTGFNQSFRLKCTQAGVADYFSGNLTATSDWQRLSFTQIFSASPSSGVITGITNVVSPTSNDLLIWGFQLEEASTATAYQRVTTQFDVTEAGVASKSYLFFDGVDDSMSAASIPFSTTDKVSVFAGARKITVGMIAQVGLIYNAEPGSFAINSTTTGYQFLFRGGITDANLGINGFASPETAVLAQLIDFSLTTNACRVRRNGLQVGASGAIVPGAATMGTKTLSIGYRSNNTTYLNGHIYGLIIRGAATSDTQVGQTETWLNARTGAY